MECEIAYGETVLELRVPVTPSRIGEVPSVGRKHDSAGSCAGWATREECDGPATGRSSSPRLSVITEDSEVLCRPDPPLRSASRLTGSGPAAQVRPRLTPRWFCDLFALLSSRIRS